MKWLQREQLGALWRSVLTVALNPERVRQLLTRNFGIKLLSLMVAFGLWSFVNFGERDTEESLQVPLELRNIPSHLMITSPRVDFIDLRVVGPRTLLGRIDRDRLAIALDLNGVRAGPAVFRVGAESLNLPRGVKMMRINPGQVTLELERVSNKSVPVHLRLIGKPPPDLQVAGTKVSPETVRVTGPESDLQDIETAQTEGVDLSKATVGSIERDVLLETVGEYVAFSANRVAIQVRIEEVEATREFKRTAIEVRNAAHSFQVTPAAVGVTVRGPKRLLSRLELPPGAVYIDATDTDAGQHEVEPSVDLPAGVRLVALDPAKVRLALSTARKSSRERR